MSALSAYRNLPSQEYLTICRMSMSLTRANGDLRYSNQIALARLIDSYGVVSDIDLQAVSSPARLDSLKINVGDDAVGSR